ncbi:MAG: hypothetical protein DHS80DRAFT_25632 [Piptocephalis tieghemiana]|nr:MAG: hypothetical protein DHS80DRAFT_25632 [Piptocephalis tieghemiana]
MTYLKESSTSAPLLPTRPIYLLPSHLSYSLPDRTLQAINDLVDSLVPQLLPPSPLDLAIRRLLPEDSPRSRSILRHVRCSPLSLLLRLLLPSSSSSSPSRTSHPLSRADREDAVLYIRAFAAEYAHRPLKTLWRAIRRDKRPYTGGSRKRKCSSSSSSSSSVGSKEEVGQVKQRKCPGNVEASRALYTTLALRRLALLMAEELMWSGKGYSVEGLVRTIRRDKDLSWIFGNARSLLDRMSHLGGGPDPPSPGGTGAGRVSGRTKAVCGGLGGVLVMAAPLEPRSGPSSSPSTSQKRSRRHKGKSLSFLLSRKARQREEVLWAHGVIHPGGEEEGEEEGEDMELDAPILSSSREEEQVERCQVSWADMQKPFSLMGNITTIGDIEGGMSRMVGDEEEEGGEEGSRILPSQVFSSQEEEETSMMLPGEATMMMSNSGMMMHSGMVNESLMNHGGRMVNESTIQGSMIQDCLIGDDDEEEEEGRGNEKEGELDFHDPSMILQDAKLDEILDHRSQTTSPSSPNVIPNETSVVTFSPNLTISYSRPPSPAYSSSSSPPSSSSASSSTSSPDSSIQPKDPPSFSCLQGIHSRSLEWSQSMVGMMDLTMALGPPNPNVAPMSSGQGVSILPPSQDESSTPPHTSSSPGAGPTLPSPPSSSPQERSSSISYVSSNGWSSPDVSTSFSLFAPLHRQRGHREMSFLLTGTEAPEIRHASHHPIVPIPISSLQSTSPSSPSSSRPAHTNSSSPTRASSSHTSPLLFHPILPPHLSSPSPSSPSPSPEPSSIGR